MMKLYISNQTEKLSNQLAHNLKSGDLFCKTVIITQGNGTNEWLKGSIAKQNGVFANFQFHNQDGFMAQLYEMLYGEKLKNNHDHIQFAVYKLLDDEDFKKKYNNVASYYEKQPLRRIQLAQRLADLFDQYQVYRSEMVDGWSKDTLSTDNPAEQWQMWLWRKLGIETKASVVAKIFLAMDVNKGLQQMKIIHPVHLFNIAIFSPLHLKFYKQLAKYIDVHFYIHQPTTSSEFQNELLESYGMKAAELIDQFSEIKPEVIDFGAPKGTHLLARLQTSILQNTELTDKTHDPSVQVHSGYTLVRELESLYNYLLDLFNEEEKNNTPQDQRLKPADILVVTPDIEKYEPFIKGVFGNGPVKLPFAVSGIPNDRGDTIISAIKRILDIREDNLTAENVLTLFEHSRIEKNYGVENIEYLRRTVDKANIRFGLHNRVEDDSIYVSWKYNLERFILGYAMLSENEYEGKYPFKDAEASVSYDLFRLKAFMDDLESLFRGKEEEKTMEQWKLFFLQNILDKMVHMQDGDKDDRSERNLIYRNLEFVSMTHVEEKVKWEVFEWELKSRIFADNSLKQKLNTGRITFSSPVPVRGLPFRIICFLGLNSGDFPRKDQFMGFDLMQDYQPLDRSIKENDKYLFLETILAAKDSIWLSYIGRDVKNNNELPPSIVLDILMNYLNIKAIQHPLQGFSPVYDDKKFFTYFYHANASIFSKKDKPCTNIPVEIDLKNFTEFFTQPIDWYFKYILGVNFDESDGTIPDTELFDLDNLQYWQVRQQLLLNPLDKNLFIDKGKKTGQLPLKNMGTVIGEQVWEEVEVVRTAFGNLVNGKTKTSHSIDMSIEGIRIKGLVDNIYDKDQFVEWSFSSNKKQYVKSKIISIILQAAGFNIQSNFIHKNGEVCCLNVSSAQEAMLRLKKLVQYFKAGCDHPLKITLKSMSIANPSVANLKRQITDRESNNNCIKILMRENFFDTINDSDVAILKELKALLNI